MKMAWPIGRIFGIPVRVHATFFLLVAWVGWMGWSEGGWRASAWAAALVIALFVCVVLHELGHSLVAMAFGAKVRSVTLYPIGGVAGLERVPRRPSRELLMALAGPSVNAVIATILTVWRGGFPAWATEEGFPSSPAELRDALIHANVILGIFNLLPAFPMDGGRVVRSLLALVLPYERATSAAASIGQALAVGLLLLGLAAGNPFISVIAVFVFLGAGREESLVRLQTVLGGMRAADVARKDFIAIRADDPVRVCSEMAASSGQQHFLVEANGRIVGLVLRTVWMRAMAEQGPETPVHVIMQRVFISIDAEAPLDRLYFDLHEVEQPIFPVVREGHILGVLAHEDIVRSVRASGPPRGQHFSPAQADRRETVQERLTVDLG